VHHFPLARLGFGAQLQVIETVTPHLKMKLETAETERENVRLDLAAMPASSVGKHASGSLRTESGEPQMQ
jgi:hypothetical protein